MKNFSILIQSVAFALMPFLAIATNTNEENKSKDLRAHTFEITPEASQFKRGAKFLGLNGKYRYSFDQNYVEFDIGYAHSSCANRSKYHIIGVFGHHFILSDDFQLTPYLGIGYRRDIFGDSSGLRNFKFSVPTLPAGLTLAYTINAKTTLKINSEYEYYIKDHINLHRGNKFDRRIPGAVRVTKNIHVMKFQPSVDIRLGSFNVEAKPYIRYTSLNRPSFDGAREIGFGLGFRY